MSFNLVSILKELIFFKLFYRQVLKHTESFVFEKESILRENDLLGYY